MVSSANILGMDIGVDIILCIHDDLADFLHR